MKYGTQVFGVLVICAGCLLHAGCCSAPDERPDTGGVITGQIDVSTGAAAIATNAGTVADQADNLAAALTGTPHEAKASAHAISARTLANETKKYLKTIEQANLAVIQYIKNAEEAIRGKTDALIKAEKYKGQRNTLIAAITAIGILLIVAAYFLVRK